MASFRSGVSAIRRGQGLAQVRSAVGRLRGYAGFWWKAFSQVTIDLTLRTHAGLQTRIVESPGLSLGDAELEQLVSQLRIVAGKTLRQAVSPMASSPARASDCRAPSSP